jgi:hypothetical protein
MFAFFNLGAQELIILLLMCLCWGGPILAIGIVLFLVLKTRRKGDLGTVAELRSEVERLREDVDRLKREPAEQDTTSDRPRDTRFIEP